LSGYPQATAQVEDFYPTPLHSLDHDCLLAYLLGINTLDDQRKQIYTSGNMEDQLVDLRRRTNTALFYSLLGNRIYLAALCRAQTVRLSPSIFSISRLIYDRLYSIATTNERVSQAQSEVGEPTIVDHAEQGIVGVSGAQTAYGATGSTLRPDVAEGSASTA
jgi:hypothetical protein